jgi:hypothetical protein
MGRSPEVLILGNGSREWMLNSYIRDIRTGSIVIAALPIGSFGKRRGAHTRSRLSASLVKSFLSLGRAADAARSGFAYRVSHT